MYLSTLQLWLTRNERYLSPAALVAGFLTDNLTLRRADLLVENIVLFTYLAIAMVGIMILHRKTARADEGKPQGVLMRLVPLAIQFSFGGLFSAYAVFYTRAASVGTSWLFLLILFAFLVGTEFFKKQYVRRGVQVTVLFVALFSFMIFFVPVILKKMGTWVFLLSGAVSIAVIALFITVLTRLDASQMQKERRTVFLGITGAYLAITGMYFLNIIPPLPLVLKDAGAYHQVMRTGTAYEVLDEERTWRDMFGLGHVAHITPGGTLYFYSSVFAPTKFNTEIMHRWQYYSKAEREWVTATEVAFPVVGGRDGGYRGYSLKSALSSGAWRVEVGTKEGHVLGRTDFEIRLVDALPPLHMETR